MDQPSHVLEPRDAGKFIATRSEHVEIVKSEITSAAEVLYSNMRRVQYSYQIWKEHEMHPKVMNEDTLNWIFVVDCLNFSFWLPKEVPQFSVNHNNKEYTDYMGLCAAINRALEEGIPIISPEYYKNLTLNDLKHIFRSSSDSALPLLEERLHCLRECGEVLCQKFNGSFVSVIHAADQSAKKLVKLIVDNFHPFRDEADYRGKRVALYKRAQILVADIWACFEARSLGYFHDIDYLTMFADYRVPVALLWLGILKYSDELTTKVNNGDLLPSGSQMEVEIRGCSIHAVELLKEELSRLVENKAVVPSDKFLVNSIIVDFYLWDYATFHHQWRQNYSEHRTRSIFY